MKDILRKQICKRKAPGSNLGIVKPAKALNSGAETPLSPLLMSPMSPQSCAEEIDFLLSDDGALVYDGDLQAPLPFIPCYTEFKKEMVAHGTMLWRIQDQVQDVVIMSDASSENGKLKVCIRRVVIVRTPPAWWWGRDILAPEV